MKKLLALVPAFALMAALMVGCGGGDDTSDSGDGESTSQNSTEAVEFTNASYCACGNEKGSESCCAEDAEECADCDFAKGSDPCCTGVEKAEAGFCACGNEKGSENCCAEAATKCTDCGFATGSTLCCKLSTEEEGS